MKDQFKDKKVNLSLLSNSIVQFFNEKDFATSLHESGEGCRIIAAPKSFHKIAENIIAYVSGRPNDFSIKFVAGSHSRALVRYGTFLTFLGGGFLVSKGLKSQEEIEKLEKEFWVYIDKKIWQLADSNHPS